MSLGTMDFVIKPNNFSYLDLVSKINEQSLFTFNLFLSVFKGSNLKKVILLPLLLELTALDQQLAIQ